MTPIEHHRVVTRGPCWSVRVASAGQYGDFGKADGQQGGDAGTDAFQICFLPVEGAPPLRNEDLQVLVGGEPGQVPSEFFWFAEGGDAHSRSEYGEDVVQVQACLGAPARDDGHMPPCSQSASAAVAGVLTSSGRNSLWRARTHHR